MNKTEMLKMVLCWKGVDLHSVFLDLEGPMCRDRLSHLWRAALGPCSGLLWKGWQGVLSILHWMKCGGS